LGLRQLELLRMAQMALGETLREIMQEPPDLPEGSEKRDNALTNLHNITRILPGRELTLGRPAANPRMHPVRGPGVQMDSFVGGYRPRQSDSVEIRGNATIRP
jgi:hypothetical protein